MWFLFQTFLGLVLPPHFSSIPPSHLSPYLNHSLYYSSFPSHIICVLLSTWRFEWEWSLSWTHIFDPQLVELFEKAWEIWPSWEMCVTWGRVVEVSNVLVSSLRLAVVSQSVTSWLLFQYCLCAWWWPTERPKYKHCLISWNSLIIISYQSNRKVTKIEHGSRNGLGFLLLLLLLLLLGLFISFAELFYFHFVLRKAKDFET